MMSLWSSKDAAKAVSGAVSGSWQAMRVEIDSRKVQAGDLFVAIAGENFDGHDYVASALEKGAVAAIVSRAPEGVASDKLLMVADTMRALEDLGAAGRTRFAGKIVGVTGSVGKTSTKEMLRVALSAHGKCFATSGNYNNHIGTPLNLANMPEDADFAVLEMGMNHAGEILHLSKMVKPHIGVITNVEAVHIEFFDGIEGIAAAKAEIFEGMKRDSAALLNRDNAQFAAVYDAAMARGVATILSFGEHELADVRLLEYAGKEQGAQVSANVAGTQYRYGLNVLGKHWACTSLLVLACAHVWDLDIQKTADALQGFKEPDGRGVVLEISTASGNVVLIDDSYNASAAAMKAAFAKTHDVWVARGKKGRKVAALGDMLELGAHAERLHKELAEALSAQAFDVVYTAGNLSKHIHENIPQTMRGAHVAQAADLIDVLAKELQADDVLLIKGSNGSKMHSVAKALKTKETTSNHKEIKNAV